MYHTCTAHALHKVSSLWCVSLAALTGTHDTGVLRVLTIVDPQARVRTLQQRTLIPITQETVQPDGPIAWTIKGISECGRGRLEVEHATSHVCILDVPEVVTDGAPALSVVIHLHTTSSGIATLQTDLEC